ncbi:diguanylate cyclase [Paenibacillus sp. PK3_47]|uniref:sensor domain-containing diguanylate cyclase n=1 Tax=Paenibacillus sp. PK3_47 TaxID=2072642 RepID=UPI00201DE5F5|nr:sensor domain-containing diguanylate cyclase [Paenibacillus sp. PK3_47]UQZ36210.1 diguanylate cyclase [Paenibacillus sp. PK3_47]
MAAPARAEAKSGRKISLTLLLIGLVTLVFVLTTTILLVASYKSKKRSLIDTTLSLNQSNAQRMSKTVDSLFRSMRTSLAYSAESLSKMNAAEPEAIDDYLELMQNSSNYFNSVILVSADGMVRSSAPQSLGITGQQVGSPSVIEAQQLKTSFLSEPHISATTGKMLVYMSEPIYDAERNYLGLIGGTIYLQDDNILNMIFGSSSIDSSGSYFYIVSKDGHLLFHPDHKRIDEDISGNEVVKQLMEGQSGQMQAINVSGISMLAGYSSVPASGWGVVVVSPEQVIQKQLVNYQRKILAYTIIPFMILLLCVFMLAHRLARPFVYLADLMSTMGKEKKKLPQLKPHWNREADLLRQAVVIAWTDIQKQTDQLTQVAMTDPLTGLTNRRSLENSINQAIAARMPFSLIVLDIDKFKFVNDTYGHLAGDEVLKHCAHILSTSIRPGDVCSRYGGEEFIIMLPRTKAGDAYVVAERIRKSLAQSKGPVERRITSSQGIAHYPTHGRNLEALLNEADQALYSAKHLGRNRTRIAGE